MTASGTTAPRVSIVIPTHDRAAILPQTIDSVLAQTFEALEVIVVDDGSTDDTPSVVARYGGRVRYLRQENRGVEAARRSGLRAARGVYVGFLDDDDLMLPEKIARQVALLDANPRFGAVHCRWHHVDGAGRVLETVGRQPEGDVRVALVWGCFPWSGGPLVRRAILEQIGDDEHLDWHGDWGLWLRVALANHDFGCVQEPLGCYRMLPGSMTDEKVAFCERLVFHLLGEVYRRWALPAELMVQKDQVHAGWHFWLGCRYAAGGFASDAARSFARVAELRPEWRDDPEPLLDLIHADATSPRVRIGEPVRLVESVLAALPPAFACVRAARCRLLARVYVALALHAHAAGDRMAAREHFEAAIDAEPRLAAAPDRFAADLVGHARRLAADDPRAFVLGVLDALPPLARGLAQARSLALAELAVVEAIHGYRLPGGRRRAARAALTALAHRPELMLRAPRRVLGRVVDRLRQPNPLRRAPDA